MITSSEELERLRATLKKMVESRVLVPFNHREARQFELLAARERRLLSLMRHPRRRRRTF